MKYVVYNKRSCSTGRRLFNYLRSTEGMEWRRKNKKVGYKQGADLILRYGSSSHPSPSGAIEINTEEAVRNASNKLIMATILRDCEDIATPTIITRDEAYNNLDLQQMFETHDEVFIRRSNGSIELSSTMESRDLYYVEPLNVEREFRVHVVLNRIMGVYEKVPLQDGVRIRKNDNCRFQRLDMGNEEVRRSVRGVRPAAKKAVEVLGLDFGGVDVVVDTEGSVYVLEVNSAPGLSDVNIERFVNIIKESSSC